MALESVPAYAGFPGGQIGQAYNEAAFRYFLDVDRWRAERSQRSLMLVLASVRQEPGRSAPLTHATAEDIFEGLASGVREVDFIGWYHEGRVAGAVLAQGGRVSDELPGAVAERILGALQRSLPANRAAKLHVRVVRLGGKAGR